MYVVLQAESERRQRLRERLGARSSSSSADAEASASASASTSSSFQRRTFVQIDDDEVGLGRHNAPPAARVQHQGRVQRSDNQEEANRVCRICLGDEEESDGDLFSPCLCRGTSAFVHRECLNTWRRMSQNSNSYWRCDSCKYNYKTLKLHHLDILKHPLFISSVSLAVIASVALVSSLVYGYLPLKDALSNRVYRLIALVPFWRRRRWYQPVGLLSSLLDNAFVSAFSLGIMGFAAVLYMRYRSFGDGGVSFVRFVVPSLALWMMQVGTVLLRLCSIIGLVAIWTKLYSEVYQHCQKWVMTHGEVVLDIYADATTLDPLKVQRARMSKVQVRILSFAVWLNEFMGVQPQQRQRQRRRQRHRGQ